MLKQSLKNPLAKKLASRLFYPRVIKSKKLFNRKVRDKNV
jgi:hypothetical protein